MMEGQVEEKTRKRGRAKGIPLTSNLPPNDRLRVFVNLILDRVKEEQAKGNLNKSIKSLGAKDA